MSVYYSSKNVPSVTTTSNDAIKYDDTLWDDIVQPVMGRRLDTSAGKLDYDYAECGVAIADSTTTSNHAHILHFGFQINHKFKLDGILHFHIHWLQAQSAVPNWWAKYRVLRNGQAATSWTEVKYDGHIYTYTSGTILQITTFPEIDMSTYNLGPSDFFDLQITRDSNNASGLFSGNDPVSGSVTIKGVDPHMEVDRPGSRDEWVK